DDLPGVRRIGEDFLIPGHAGVEHDLAARFPFRARRVAFERRPVFERQNRLHLLLLSRAKAAQSATNDLPWRSSRSLREKRHFSNDAVTRCRSLAATRTEDDQCR